MKWKLSGCKGSVWVWNLEAKALGPWVIFLSSFESSISSIFLWWLKYQHCYNHKITSAETAEKEENRPCHERLILCVVLSLMPLVDDAQKNVSTCSLSWFLGRERKAIGNALQSLLVYTGIYDFSTDFSPDQRFTSDIQTQKTVIAELFFITFLYRELGNSLLCKFHRGLSPETLSICVL